MATIKVIIRPEKTKKNGEVPLYIRMTRDRKSKYVSLRQSLLPKFWDAAKQRVRKSHPNAARLNAFIAEKRAEVEALALDVDQGRKSMRRKAIRSVLEDGGDESFFALADQLLMRLAAEERHGTRNTYHTGLKCFRRWLKEKQRKSDLSFGQLRTDLLKSYRDYLENERGNKPATVILKIATLKSIVGHAREDGVVSGSFNPFVGLKVRKRKAKKVIPTTEEMALIEMVELPHDSNMDHVRNLYVFCANMAGLRFSDAITLRWGQVVENRLRWKTRKTGKQRLVYIPKTAREILEGYAHPDSQGSDFVFPFLRGLENADKQTLHRACNNKNVNANATLRRICQRAGLERTFSFHTSRHFFATDSLRRGMRVEVLQHLLTHSSISQTMEYAQIVNEDMDAAMMAYEQAKMG